MKKIWTKEEIKEAVESEGSVVKKITNPRKNEFTIYYICHCTLKNGFRTEQIITWDDYNNRRSVRGCRNCNYKKRREAHNKTYEQIKEKLEHTPYILIEPIENFEGYTTVFQSYLCKCKENGHHVQVVPSQIEPCYKCIKKMKKERKASSD